MLLFSKRSHAGLVDGSITLTFRRWAKPHVKPGGRYRCHPIGVLEVDGVHEIEARSITAAEAKRAGFSSLEELRSFLSEGGEKPLAARDTLFRVELHYGGDGDRVPIALEDKLSADDVKEITAKLAKMDAKTAWTKVTLAIIQKTPRVAASKLAKQLGRETLPFKADVVKLKKLGLTQSFEVGYEISPRGKAFLSKARSLAASVVGKRERVRYSK